MERGIEREDVAMSLLVQGYAFRVASLAIGSWLMTGGCVDVSPANVSIRLGRGRPNEVLLGRAAWAAEPVGGDAYANLADLQSHLIGGHLSHLVATARASIRIGERLLWSNIASACASSFGAFMRLEQPPDHPHWARIRLTAEAFFESARSDLRDAGDVIAVGPVWAWQRRACCLYYCHSGGARCDDCSLNSATERTARLARIERDFEEN